MHRNNFTPPVSDTNAPGDAGGADRVVRLNQEQLEHAISKQTVSIRVTILTNWAIRQIVGSSHAVGG
jgi:hypothetical protein